MAHRNLTDELGRSWLVWEVTPGAIERRKRSRVVEHSGSRQEGAPRVGVAANLREGWLAFESKRDKRRLAPAPEGWLELSDEELLVHLNQATRLGPTRRLIE